MGKRKSAKIDANAIIIAIITLIGTLGAAYFISRGNIKPTEMIIGATETAQAKVIFTLQPSQTFSPVPTSTSTPTPSFTPNPLIQSGELVEMVFELYGSGLDGAEVTIQTSTGLTVMTIYIPQGTRQTVTLPKGDYTYKVVAKGLLLPTPWPCWTTTGSDSGSFSVKAGTNNLVAIPIGQYAIPSCKP